MGEEGLFLSPTVKRVRNRPLSQPNSETGVERGSLFSPTVKRVFKEALLQPSSETGVYLPVYPGCVPGIYLPVYTQGVYRAYTSLCIYLRVCTGHIPPCVYIPQGVYRVYFPVCIPQGVLTVVYTRVYLRVIPVSLLG